MSVNIDTELSQYLQGGSPFLPQIDLGILDAIIRDLSLEEGYVLGEAIAKGLTIVPSEKAFGALSTKSGERSAKPEDLSEYFVGFNRPFSMLMAAYAGLLENNGLETAKRMISLSYENQSDESDFLLNNISLAVNLLRADWSGVELVNHVVKTELLSTSNIYYKIGLEAARKTFIAYMEILDTLIWSNSDAQEKPNALFARLVEFEKVAPNSPKPLPKKAIKLENSLARVLENPSCGTILLMFLRHPFLISKSISLFVRFIRSLIRDPITTELEMSKVANTLPRAQEKIREGWEPGRLISNEASEFSTVEERLSNIVPIPPYTNRRFVEDIRRIRVLRNASHDTKAVEKLFNEWTKLIKRSGVSQYSALWTTIHITFGDFAKHQFVLFGEKDKRFIKAAKRAFSAPLKLSPFVKADLGTRCICAARLGELFVKHGSHLEMTPIELAVGVYNAYSEVLKSNERLYIRSPYKDSRERLLDRAPLAISRTVEACVYLAERDQINGMKWHREALLISENGKSRMIRGELALADRLPPQEIPASLCNDENKSLDRLREIYASDLIERKSDDLSNKSSLSERTNEVVSIRLELETIWTRMENLGGNSPAYVSMRRDEGIRWTDLRGVAERLGKRFALISMYRLPDAVFLSLFRASWEAPKSYIIPLSDEYLNKSLNAYQQRSHLFHEWQELGDVLFSPMQHFLSDVEYIYFFPHGPFNRLPLHALIVNEKPLIEQWAVVYAPSISVLESTLARPKSKGDTLIMGYASFRIPNQIQSDQMILDEVDELAAHFQTQPIISEFCDSETLIQSSPSARLIHLACHGEFVSGDPFDSRLYLADKAFTARDWIGLRLQADLVTLSACESGVSQIHPGGDPVGLTRAILFAGASSLLTTLWAVDSLSTLEWMLKFYKNIWDRGGLQLMDKAAAFRKATLELMNDQDFRDPYYWAPFILVGNYE